MTGTTRCGAAPQRWAYPAAPALMPAHISENSPACLAGSWRAAAWRPWRRACIGDGADVEVGVEGMGVVTVETRDREDGQESAEVREDLLILTHSLFRLHAGSSGSDARGGGRIWVLLCYNPPQSVSKMKWRAGLGPTRHAWIHSAKGEDGESSASAPSLCLLCCSF